MLITFEGGEACGKTTQIALFKSFLTNNNIDFLSAREPGGTKFGEEIREILLHSKEDISSRVEFLLFSASRAKLVDDVIKPALKEGKVVVLDRYFDSSFAYQGYAGDLDLSDIENITNFAINGVVPDITFLLDLSYEQSMERKRGDAQLKNLDRIESKKQEFHNKVREGFLSQAKRNSGRFVVIDATLPKEEIAKKIQEEFIKIYKK